jgi:zinc protease
MKALPTILRLRQFFLTSFFLAVLSTSATAADSATETNVTRATLTNGLRVIIVQNPLAPVATTVINYLVGSDETPPGFPGTAHATEHMIKGSGMNIDIFSDGVGDAAQARRG